MQIKTEQEINSINDVKSSILNQIEQLNEVIKSEKDSIVDTDKTISSLNKEIELNKKMVLITPQKLKMHNWKLIN